jgi:hypothetical protein
MKYGRTASGLIVLLAMGCQSGPTDEDYDDVAAGLGALVSDGSGGGELGSMDDALSASSGEVPTGLTATGEGTFEGPRAGLDYAYSVSCLDAAGAALSVCERDVTDTARVTVDWSGSLTLPRYSATIARTGDWTISGLKGETAEFNGHGTFDVDAEFMALYRPVTRTFSLSYDAVYDGILIRTSDRMPMAGEIHYDVDARRTRERGSRTADAEFHIEAVVVFGNGTATITLDGTRTYHVSLETGEVTAG